MEQYDFILATIADESVCTATTMSVINLMPSNKFKFIWFVGGGGGTARTRNIHATNFLRDGKAPYLIFLDRDIVFTESDIVRMLEDLRGGYHLVGGCYPVKDGTRIASSGNVKLDGGINEVGWLATGFMGISRELLQKMVDELHLPLMHKGDWSEAYPFFEDHRYHCEDGNWMYLTEDYDFCMKARKVGVKAYLDTQIWLEHIGIYRYSIKDIVSHLTNKQLATAMKTDKEGLVKALQSTIEGIQ